MSFTSIRYEEPAAGVIRVVLARPEARNAQDKRLLCEVNDAFDLAAQDDGVKVVILAADGPHFSSGHDLRDFITSGTNNGLPDDRSPVGCWGGFDLPGVEGWMAMEEELFLGLCWRWRNFPKPTIAQVQGKAIAGGLMLVWVCDLIVAAADAEFSDPVVAFGVNGHEFFVHPWELGPRRAKEMLYTGDAITAEEARQLGMVNRVVDLDQLESSTLQLAQHIARQPSMGLKLAKQAVNQALDAQGQWTALQAAFSLHQIGHANNLAVHGTLVDPSGAASIRTAAQARVRTG
jgi:enoyl-CoA hydratase